jgi:hypothetical protein
MQYLKQSTAATVLVGPVLDADGAAVTGAVIGDFRLAKNGTVTTMSGNTISHSHNGCYLIALTTGNTDTLNRLSISLGNTAYAMTVFRYTVLTANQFDALVTNGTVTPAAIADATWDEATVDHTSTGSFGAGVGYIITTVAAILVGVNQLTSRITTGVATMFADLIQMITGSGTVNARFTTKALENVATGSVYVLPTKGTQQDRRVSKDEIEIYKTEGYTLVRTVTDAVGANVDLSGKTLELIIEGENRNDKAVIPDADIDISGTGNATYTVEIPTTVSAKADKTYNFYLWDKTNAARPKLLDKGRFVVEYAGTSGTT